MTDERPNRRQRARDQARCRNGASSRRARRVDEGETRHRNRAGSFGGGLFRCPADGNSVELSANYCQLDFNINNCQLVFNIDKPTSGQVLLDGIDVGKMPENQLYKIRRDKMGFVFQTFNLLPYLNARENVELPMEGRGKSKSEQKKRASELLA